MMQADVGHVGSPTRDLQYFNPRCSVFWSRIYSPGPISSSVTSRIENLHERNCMKSARTERWWGNLGVLNRRCLLRGWSRVKEGERFSFFGTMRRLIFSHTIRAPHSRSGAWSESGTCGPLGKKKKTLFWEYATRGTIISLVKRPPTQRYYYSHCYYFYCYLNMKKTLISRKSLHPRNN